MCKFVYIFRTDENPFGSCQPCSNNIHITYDDNTAAHRAAEIFFGITLVGSFVTAPTITQ